MYIVQGRQPLRLFYQTRASRRRKRPTDGAASSRLLRSRKLTLAAVFSIIASTVILPSSKTVAIEPRCYDCDVEASIGGSRMQRQIPSDGSHTDDGGARNKRTKDSNLKTVSASHVRTRQHEGHRLLEVEKGRRSSEHTGITSFPLMCTHTARMLGCT